jgi:uncharacterized protein (TIGR02757 family)
VNLQVRSMQCRMEGLRPRLDALFATWHRPEFIAPDPLQFVRPFARVEDREIAGLVAASLAFGRVASILRSVGRVLGAMGSEPATYVDRVDRKELAATFRGFRHRWTTSDELVDLLLAIRQVRREYGSLGDCLISRYHRTDATVLPALRSWVDALLAHQGRRKNSLLPDPSSPSACKRLHLYLRWMVRHDEVDPGGWPGISPAKLVVPLDVHMFRACRTLGLTRRKQAGLAAALEITAAFRLIAPDDPVRYDFALTRPGIRGGKASPAIPTSWRR